MTFLRNLSALVLSALFVLMVPYAALAQGDDQDPPQNAYTALLDNVDFLVDNYSNFLARKYSLTDQQLEHTGQMLRERSHAFLDKHEDELRTLVARLFEVRAGAEMSPEELREWGTQVAPLYFEAKDLIVKGNEDWRGMLTDEQKTIHDGDLKMMSDSFATTEEQLNRIVDGKMTVDEFRNPRKLAQRNRKPRQQAAVQNEPGVARSDPSLEAPEVVVEPPAVPARPERPQRLGRGAPPMPPGGDANAEVSHEAGGESPGQVIRPPGQSGASRVGRPDSGDSGGRDAARVSRGRTRGSASGKDWETRWDQYVREFIERYELNDAQQQQAQSILKDCKARGGQLMASKKAEFDAIDARTAELNKSGDKNKSQTLAELSKKRTALRAPLDDIFEKQLKPRLDRLLTRAQRKAGDAKKPSGRAGRATDAPTRERSAKPESPKAQPEGIPPEAQESPEEPGSTDPEPQPEPQPEPEHP